MIQSNVHMGTSRRLSIRALALGVAAVLLIAAFPAVVSAGPISDSDFVMITSDTVPAFTESSAAVTVRVDMKTAPASFTIPLSFAGYPGLSVDTSIVSSGNYGVTYDSLGNDAAWFIKTSLVDNVNKTILLGFVSFTSMAPSAGPLVTIHFKVDATVAPGVVTIDSTFVLPANTLSFVTEPGAEYTPQFTAGNIVITGDTGGAPQIVLTPDSISFSGVIGAANPPPQTLSLINGGGDTLVWDAWASKDQTWLSVSPTSGTGNADLTVSVVTGATGAAGTFLGDITVRDLHASNSPQVVPVTFNITKPTLNTSPLNLYFTATTGGTDPPSRTIQLWASSDAVIPFTATPSESWISVVPGSGNTPVNIKVSVDISGLGPGVHSGVVHYASPSSLNSINTSVFLTLDDGNNYSDSDFVTLGGAVAPLQAETNAEIPITIDTKTPAAAMTIPLSYAGLPSVRLNHAIGDQGVVWDSVAQSSIWHVKSVLDDPAAKTVLLGLVSFSTALPPTVGQLATLNFIVDSTDTSGINDIDTTFIPPNNFLSIVTEAAVEYIPQFTPGSVEVAGLLPHLELVPTSLSFTAVIDSGNPAAKKVMVNNTGPGTLHWWAAASKPWLHIDPVAGSDGDSMAVWVDVTGLSLGTYGGQITVDDSLAGNAPQVVNVSLKIVRGINPADSNYVAVGTAFAPLHVPSKVEVPVYMGSADSLWTIVVPLSYAGYPTARIDTSEGNRGVTYDDIGTDPTWAIKPVSVDSINKKIVFAFLSIGSFGLPPAEGRLATVHFLVDSPDTAGTLVIDSTTVPPGNSLGFGNRYGLLPTPAFAPGAIVAREFVDSICVSPETIYLRAPRLATVMPCTSLIVTNCGGSHDFAWTMSANCDWLDFPDSGYTGDRCYGERCSYSICANTTTMDEGLYICTLTVASPGAVNSPVKIPVGYRIDFPEPPPPFDGFYAGLTLSDDDGVVGPDYVELGTTSSATDGYDSQSDIFKVPPPPGPYLRLFLPHPEWGQFQDEYQTDVRANYPFGCKDWELVVETDHMTPVRLGFELVVWPAHAMTYQLLDPDGTVLSNDLLANDFSFVAMGGRRKFVLRACASEVYTAFYRPGWNLVSSPVAPSDPSWDAIFDGVFRTYQVFGWNGGYYPPPGYPGCGAGYWVFAPDSAAVHYEGARCFGDSAGSFMVDLDVGWNLFGLPFPLPLGLWQLGADSAGVQTDFFEALDRGWLTPTIWEWDGSYRGSTSLVPGKGYWIPSVLPGIKLVFTPPIDCVLTAMPVVPPSEAFTAIRLVGSESEVRIGMAADAHAGFDSRYDWPLPPSGPEPSPGLALRSNLHPQFADYAQDIRAEVDEASWIVAITHAAGRSQEILAEGLGKLEDQGYVMYLERSPDAEWVRLHEGVAEATPGTEFVLHAVRGAIDPDVRPDHYYLAANFPNPFNPATSIRFGLAASGHAELEIYNVLGRKIRTLVNAEYPAGEFEIVWNGTDDAGRPVASGLYFYRLRTADFRETRKMLLMK